MEWFHDLWTAISCSNEPAAADKGPSNSEISFNKGTSVRLGGKSYRSAELPNVKSKRGVSADDSLEETEDEMKYGALGLVIRRMEADGKIRFRVMSVAPKSAARESGKVRAGMTLTHVGYAGEDPEELGSKSAYEAALLLLGAPNSTVDLHFLSNRSAHEMELLAAAGDEHDEGKTAAPPEQPSSGEQSVKIVVTLKRQDPADFVDEDAEMARFRRLGNALNSCNIRV